MTNLTTRLIKPISPRSSFASLEEAQASYNDLVRSVNNLILDLEFDRQNTEIWANRVNRLSFEMMFMGA